MKINPFMCVLRDDKAALIASLQLADINAIEPVSHGSLLHEAVGNRVPDGKPISTEIAEELVKRGIDVNHRDKNGFTALAYAARYNRRDIATIILNAGGRPNITDDHGNQPLWYAAGNPHPDYELIELLIRHGADPGHRNKYGKCPLDIAHEDEGDLNMLRLFGETSK